MHWNWFISIWFHFDGLIWLHFAISSRENYQCKKYCWNYSSPNGALERWNCKNVDRIMNRHWICASNFWDNRNFVTRLGYWTFVLNKKKQSIQAIYSCLWNISHFDYAHKVKMGAIFCSYCWYFGCCCCYARSFGIFFAL